MGQSTYKVPGGKMLKIQLLLSEEKIKEITIMGDFFLHPEETVIAIEEHLQGLKPDRTILTESIQKVLDEKKALLIGAEAKDIAEAIIMAL